MQKAALVQETVSKSLVISGLGLGTMSHVLPFHSSASVLL
jgi:hypothetical protein